MVSPLKTPHCAPTTPPGRLLSGFALFIHTSVSCLGRLREEPVSSEPPVSRNPARRGGGWTSQNRAVPACVQGGRQKPKMTAYWGFATREDQCVDTRTRRVCRISGEKTLSCP